MKIIVITLLSFSLVSCATINLAGTIGVKDLNCDPGKNINGLTSQNDEISVTYDIKDNTATVRNTSSRTLRIDEAASYYIDNKECVTRLNIYDKFNSGSILTISPYSSATIMLPAHSCSIKIYGNQGEGYKKTYSFNNSKLTSQYAFSYSFDSGEGGTEQKYWRDGLYLAKAESNSNRYGAYYTKNNIVTGSYSNKTEILVCSICGILSTTLGVAILSSGKESGYLAPEMNLVKPVLGVISLASGIALVVNVPIAIIRDKKSGYSISVDL